ncbi:VWA domain-containing protein [Candidatus Woesearchaeota archaeon]|nr:VWA domain-containing protein [Candidatus Woesearchaeota archaeon]
MEITFTHPVYLWFLLSIPLLIATHFLTLRFTQLRALKFANYKALERVTGKKVITKNYTLLAFRLSILFFLIFSIAGAVLWYEGKVSDFSYVIALDASGSMIADDFHPSRFEAAKETAQIFVDSIGAYTDIGLVSFAGTASIESDMTILKNNVNSGIRGMEISPSGGTDLGEAIITSANLLEGADNAKAIVLLTDGQSNVGTHPDTGIEFARRKNVAVHTIGIGTEQGGKFAGIDIISMLDEPLLKKISSETGGKYFRAESKEDLAAAFMEIASFNIQNIPIKLQVPLLFLSLLLLFIEWGMINTRFRILP